MRNTLLFSSLLLALLYHTTAQASRAEIMAFPMPPPSGYSKIKSYSYVGDYGYYTYPSPSKFAGNGAAKASDYKYVRYENVSGKRVFIYASFATPIPAATPTTDACGHAHTSYGVWAYNEMNFFFTTYKWWSFVGGAGMSGKRETWTKPCKIKVDNDLAAIDERFGWGSDFLELDFRANSYVKAKVIGALSNTHGWGSCTAPSGQFKACYEPSYIISYTLP